MNTIRKKTVESSTGDFIGGAEGENFHLSITA
jgi:hypothetical protein